MRTFRATYDVRELGILKGDWISVEKDRWTLTARWSEPSDFPRIIRHLAAFDLVEGPPLSETASSRSLSDRPALRLIR